MPSPNERIPVNEFARRYLEDLLSFFGLNVRVEDKLTEDGQRVELNVPSTRLNGFLIGQAGRNLGSLEHLTNMAVWAGGYEQIRVGVDVAGYKAQQAQRLTKRTQEVTRTVLDTGQPHEFEPMNAAQRRVIHQTVGEIAGVESASAGEGRTRHVVIKPTSTPSTDKRSESQEVKESVVAEQENSVESTPADSDTL